MKCSRPYEVPGMMEYPCEMEEVAGFVGNCRGFYYLEYAHGSSVEIVPWCPEYTYRNPKSAYLCKSCLKKALEVIDAGI